MVTQKVVMWWLRMWAVILFAEKKWEIYVSLAVKKAKDSSQMYYNYWNISFREGNEISYSRENFAPWNLEYLQAKSDFVN